MKKLSLVLFSFVCASAVLADGAGWGSPATTDSREEKSVNRTTQVGSENANRRVFDDELRSCTPFELALFAPLQVPSTAYDVKGLRLDLIWGINHDVYGLDLGLAGYATGNARGLQITGFNFIDRTFAGAQFGALANIVSGNAYGLQLAGVFNYDLDLFMGAQIALVNDNRNFYGMQLGGLNWNWGYSKGFQLSLLNVNENEFTGMSIGAVNVGTYVSGAQFGLVNVATGSMRGLQVGCFNAAEVLQGLQIGVLNVAANSKLPILPIVNARF